MCCGSGCLLAPCSGEQTDGRQPPEGKRDEGRALRFVPGADLNHRLFLVYDLQVPSQGVLRTTAAMRVTRAAEQGRHLVMDHEFLSLATYAQGTRLPGEALTGVHLRMERGADFQLHGGVQVLGEPKGAGVAKATGELMCIGNFIEFPKRKLKVGDSWTTPPRKVIHWGGMEATLQPSFTLLNFVLEGASEVAEIASDMEISFTPTPLSQGFTLKGKGSATGNFRVRVSDGVVLESQSRIRFSQELTTDAAMVVGYQEFLGSAQTFVEEGDEEVDLAAISHPLQPRAKSASCDLTLSSLGQRLRKLPRHQAMVFGASLKGMNLPRAGGGQPIDSPGSILVLPAEGPATLDSLPVAREGLAKALREFRGGGSGSGSEAPRVLYLYAEGSLGRRALVPLLGPLGRAVEVRLVVKDPQTSAQVPERSEWQAQQAAAALDKASGAELLVALDQLLRGYLGLCALATRAYADAVTAGQGWEGLVDAIPGSFLKCGCDTTDLPSLEATLYTVAGTPDLRWLPLELPRRGDPSLQELAESAAPAAGLAEPAAVAPAAVAPAAVEPTAVAPAAVAPAAVAPAAVAPAAVAPAAPATGP